MNDLVKSASPADITQPNERPDRINAAHEQVKQALQRGAEHAIEAGRLLLQAKATVRHGDWLEWIGTNCKFAERSAQLYMRLAEERPLSRFLLRVYSMKKVGAPQDFSNPQVFDAVARWQNPRRTWAMWRV